MAFDKNKIKKGFAGKLNILASKLKDYVATSDGQRKIKGFIDIYQNIYTISSDTKIVSKILEIHLFPLIKKFAEENNLNFILAEAQNRYPDISFVDKTNEKIKFAVDLKTTYRLPTNQDSCNGFTLGSHGEYFRNRSSTKNIQFPYKDYLGHYCLGIIYDRAEVGIDETRSCKIKDIKGIESVISNFTFFVNEKRAIASDKGGSGNTANIGSIKHIPDIIAGNGVFKNLGEKRFDDYWTNFGVLNITKKDGSVKKLSSIEELLEFKNHTSSLPNKRKKNGR